MDALVIAAGHGNRISTIAPSKPLARIAGMPLIGIVLRRLAVAGVARVVVVTGHRAEAVEAVLSGLAVELGMLIEPCRLEDWSQPNGYSVMAGAELMAGDFLLVMADHLFGPGMLELLMQQGGADRGVTLAIDRRTNSVLLDPDDATWVQTDGAKRIAAIGKTLMALDAVDCGAFLATAELPAAIRESIALGRPGSLSDGMQVLADQGRAAIMDIGETWWLDVDDAASHAVACRDAPSELAEIFGTGSAGVAQPPGAISATFSAP